VRNELARRYPFLTWGTQRRLIHAYGTLSKDMLGDARSAGDMGRCFGCDLTEREVDWLMRTEWARTAADVVWRRSKLGLRLNAAQVDALEDYLARQTVSAE
jgi:glycerol-3-phosphate dehydrogenase